MRIGVLAPMKPELMPIVKVMALTKGNIGDLVVSAGTVGNCEVVAVKTGIGMEPAEQITHRLLDATPIDHIMVVGIAGGIEPHVKLGDLVLPEIVVDERTGKEYRPSPLDGAPSKGIIQSSNELLVDKEEIARRGRQGVWALDMETGAVGAACEARGTSWSTYRAISDLAGDPMFDEDMMKISGPDGTGNPKALFGYLAKKPSRIAGLLRLTKGMRAATQRAANAALGACLSV